MQQKNKNSNKMQIFVTVLLVVNLLSVAVLYYLFFVASNNSVFMAESNSERLHIVEAKTKCLETQSEKDCIKAKMVYLSLKCHPNNSSNDAECEKLQDYREQYNKLINRN
mgnify:CR=1 FL=1